MADEMSLFDAVYARRSVREFLPDPVPAQILERIVAAGLEAPTGCNAQFRQYMIITDPGVMDQLRTISSVISDAPAAIVQLIEPKATRFGEYYLQDAAASVQTMLLATVALGYASCWLEGIVRKSYEEIRNILNVPAEINISAILPIGKPAAAPARPAKTSLADATHYDQFSDKSN